MGEIIFIEKKTALLRDFSAIKNLIYNLTQLEGKEVGQLSFVFMSDDDLLSYNTMYLNHDFYTDVITFDNSVFPIISGDILISVDRVIDNAKAFNINYKNEFLRVIIHGVLHLCGYMDNTVEEQRVIRSKEDYYIAKINTLS